MTNHQTAMKWIMVLTTCFIIPIVLVFRDSILQGIAEHPNLFLLVIVVIAMVLAYLKLSKEEEGHENK